MRITLFEGNRVETFTSLAAAAYAAKTWYSDLENETPPWITKSKASTVS